MSNPGSAEPRPSRRTRLRDIADALGLAVITISKGLRDHPDIRVATREKIRLKAQELHYTPNIAARSLVTQRSYVVGIVVPDLMISYFAEVTKAIAEQLRKAGYEIFLSNSEGDPKTEAEEVQRLLGRQVDGLIIASSFLAHQKQPFDNLLQQSVPFILIDRSVRNVRASFVGTNDALVGKLATDHLIHAGCKHIAHLKGPDTSTGIGRLAGYRGALEQAGLTAPPEFVAYAASSVESGCQAMRSLLGQKLGIDGVFCYNDLVAAGALRACLADGVRVPQDIAIIGCGNHCLTDLLLVPLSTVDQDTRRIGLKAADMLLQQLRGDTPGRIRRVLIQPAIVERESTRRV